MAVTALFSHVCNLSRLVIPSAAPTAPSHSSGANSTANASRAAVPAGPPCDCKQGGPCECSVPKHAPRNSANSAAVAAVGGSENGKPPGLTRSQTYHAPSSSMSSLSMSHDAHQLGSAKHHGGSALQRSGSHHGSTATVAPPGSSSSYSHSSINAANNTGSHHPQPQHHHARHFAPYQVAHHSHHYHARFDVPEDNDAGDMFVGAAAAVTPEAAAAFRRNRSSSVSHGDLARPFPPPAPMYLNNAAAMSLPDVLAWSSSSDINSFSPYNPQQLTDATRSTSYLPASAAEFDAFSANSADNFIRQFGSASSAVLEDPQQQRGMESYPANPNTTGPAEFSPAGGPPPGVDMQFGSAIVGGGGNGGGLPEFRFASADVGLNQLGDRGNAFDYSNEGALGYSGGSSGTSSDYDAMMASFLSLPQPSIPAFGSGPGTSGSSRPPSMTGSGSWTSRSSSRASGGLPSGLDLLEMTSTAAAASNAMVGVDHTGSISPGDMGRGRLPRGFPPIADPFENESSTAIPPFDAYERPLTQRRLSPLNIDKPLSSPPSLSHSHSHSHSHTHSPMSISQESAPSAGAQDDGSGTQFPAWPQQQSPIGVSVGSAGSGAGGAAGYSPFDATEAFEFPSPAGAALMYQGQRGPSLEFDDSAWNPRA